MTARWLVVLLLGAALGACGKYGPPQRTRPEAAPVVNSLEPAPAAGGSETADDEEEP